MISDDIKYIENPLNEIILEFIKNAPQMTPEAQKAVAQYISYQSQPVITMSYDQPKGKL